MLESGISLKTTGNEGVKGKTAPAVILPHVAK